LHEKEEILCSLSSPSQKEISTGLNLYDYKFKKMKSLYDFML
jgi:hypothetical protein